MTINTNTYLDNRPEGIETWIEPESQLKYSKHPHNKVIAQTPSGSSFHMDSTPEYEHHRIQHRSGSYTEVQNDGTEVHKIVGDGYEIISKNKNVLIKGYCNITIEGNCTMHVKGDYVQRIDGDFFQEIRGDSTTYVAGDCSVSSSGDMDLSVGGLLSDITLSSSEGVQVHGDLDVTGKIATKSDIHAEKNITSSQKVTSIMGLATMGGLSIGGIPADLNTPAPGFIVGAIQLDVPTINAINIKTEALETNFMTCTSSIATGSLFSPGIVDAAIIADLGGTLGTLRSRYNSHIHGGVEPGAGFTSATTAAA
jgi:hypothetical protein